jgi:outer membrane protein assembly factor BamB
VLTALRWSAPPALAVVLALAGCAADDGRTDHPAAATSAAPRSTAAEGFPVYAADDVQQARLRLPGGPDWLAVTDDGVWVKKDDGTLDRIDPDTGKSALSVELPPGDLCQGVGAGLGSVWACDGTDVLRIDPATGKVTATFRLNKTATQGHLVTASGRLWLLTGDGSTLLGVDPGTGQVVTTIPLAARGTDLGAGDAGLWVASQPDGQALRIDPDAGTVVVRATGLDRPLAVAVTDSVWVGGASATVRLDPASGAVQATAAIGVGLDGGLAADADAVWVRNDDRLLVRLDATDGTPVSGVSADVGNAGDVAVAFGSVWTTAADDASLFRLPAD